VDKSDLLSKTLPIVEDISMNECYQYEREFQMLKYFTEEKCSSTPQHIANFQRNGVNPWAKNGFLCFVVMTRVPGRNVFDIWSFDPATKDQRDEQHQIQQAFKKALV
jgi:hypothetical protein